MSDLYQEHLVKKERTAADSAVRIAVIGFTALFVVAGLCITPFEMCIRDSALQPAGWQQPSMRPHL